MNFTQVLLLLSLTVLFSSCFNSSKKSTNNEVDNAVYPSDVIPFMDEWKILLGDGTYNNKLVNYQKDGFFFVQNEGETNWVVYKTPNLGVTSRTSKNTRTELGQIKRWKPLEGGKLTGTLKVMHVSSSGDARVASSYSVVVGQIHSDEGHENEPLKIFYKKFPGHSKGSVFWNYEINTAGDNAKRWDYSTPAWGYDNTVVGYSADEYPDEPVDGIALGEEFSYEVNVYKGVMYLTFASEGHETVTFTKNLVKSDFATKIAIPEQIKKRYPASRSDGIERENAYAGELQFFKQGAYNQTRSKCSEDSLGMNSKTESVADDIERQYANGCYAEVWFKEASVGAGTPPADKN
ncbi:polysaccharide lyase family 7 protein [Carboxylicivirga sp. RSCT41]|uniref:polysaccharide lyase family 7 protein n=1 Tax=Carboxylicivirga agarovorans TaxID=3417570 RepID=UPI003D32EF55